MSVIIQDLPFRPYETRLNLSAQHGEIVVLHRQIIVWLSLTRPDIRSPSAAPRFPAVLDTGLNESLVISRSHLSRWTGVSEDELPVADDRKIRVYQEVVLPRDANLWLHHNLPFSLSEVTEEPPVQIEIDAGIIVSGTSHKPRLPLLGLRAIESSNLLVMIDGKRQTVAIERLE